MKKLNLSIWHSPNGYGKTFFLRKMVDEANASSTPSQGVYIDCLQAMNIGLTPQLNLAKQEKLQAILDKHFDGLNPNKDNLSSGEYYLIILLSKVIKLSNAFVIAIDLPETALHIDWQRKLVSILLELAPKSHFHIATHSPIICSQYRDNLINLSEVKET